MEIGGVKPHCFVGWAVILSIVKQEVVVGGVADSQKASQVLQNQVSGAMQWRAWPWK